MSVCRHDVGKYYIIIIIIMQYLLQAEMNWASRRMYYTHKRAIVYVLYYGMIDIGCLGTPTHPLEQTLIICGSCR